MRRLELPRNVWQKHVPKHPESQTDGNESRDAAGQVVPAKVGKRGNERQEAKAQQEVRDKHAADKECPQAEYGSTGRSAVRPAVRAAASHGLLGRQSERERREQNEDPKRAGVETVDDARAYD